MKKIKGLWLSLSLAFLALVPSKAKSKNDNSIPSRINSIRKTLKSKDLPADVSKNIFKVTSDQLRADWANWGNWGNWNNWNNWNNWYKWSKWDNWVNWGNAWGNT